MTWVVRAAEQRDLEAWKRLYTGYCTFYGRATSDEHLTKLWSWIHDSNQITCLVAVSTDGGEPVGLAHMRTWVRPLRGVISGYLDDLFVDPDHRGSGVVDALFSAMNEMGRREGWDVIRWTTGDDNYRARAVYDKLAQRTGWITYDMTPTVDPAWRTASDD